MGRDVWVIMSAKSKKKKKAVHVGLSISHSNIEVAVYNPKTNAIDQAFSASVPEGLFDDDADRVLDPAHLKEIIGDVIRGLKPKPSHVHLSIPGTLLRMVEMPRMGDSELFIALSGEAERYKTFDETDAIVDFAPIESSNPNISANQHMIVFGAARSDTLSIYNKIITKDLKLKLASVSLEPLNVLRAMAGTGVLDSLIMQIGTDAPWGAIFVEPTRIRISLWQANRMLELRETQMDTREFLTATGESMVVEDIVEEIRRTTKMAQPTIWLTHNMPMNMEGILADKLGVPFRAAPLGDSITIHDEIQVATIGTAMSSIIDFPFDFDILSGVGKTLDAGGGGGLDEGSQGNIDWIIPVGAAILVLCLIGTAVVYGINFTISGKVPELEGQQAAAQTANAALQSEINTLKAQVDQDTRLLDVIGGAAVRNKVYVKLSDDIRHKVPEGAWVRSIDVTAGALEIQGVSKSDKQVVNFAKQFNNSFYAQGVGVESIKQKLIGGTPVFDFMIKGTINTDPSLLKQFAPPPPVPGTEAGKTEDKGAPKP